MPYLGCCSFVLSTIDIHLRPIALTCSGRPKGACCSLGYYFALPWHSCGMLLLHDLITVSSNLQISNDTCVSADAEYLLGVPYHVLGYQCAPQGCALTGRGKS